MIFNKVEEVELGKCIELIIDNRGKTPKKMGGDWVKQGIKTISAKNVHGGKLSNLNDIRFVSNDVYEKWMKVDVKRGDCLLVSEGATLGENMYWDSNEKIVLGQRLFAIRTNNNILDSRYFSAYMNTRKYQKEIDGRATGTSVSGLRQTELLKTKVKVRPIEEQRFIGNLYYNVNKKIETNSKITKKLEQMAQAIYKQWFVDFEFPNEEGEPYKSNGGKMIESDMGFIPQGWKLGSIYNISDVVYGAPFSSKLFNEEGIGLPLIRIRDLKTFTPAFYTNEQHKSATIINPGDVLVGMDAEFTPTIWRGENGYLNQRVCMFKSNKEYVHNYFIFEAIKPYMKFFEHSKVGTTVIHLGKCDIDNMKILNPSKEKLELFSLIIDPIYNKLIEISKENIILTNLRDIVVPKLMSDEIKVSV
ncbi:restriction endonuclease subunit S [Clostridium sp. JNZ J1-5]